LFFFLLFESRAKAGLAEWVFPFYDFSMHNEETVLVNKTKLGEEMEYYREIKKRSLFHIVGSALTGFVVLNSFAYLAPVTVSYWGYHVYMNHKAAHLEQQYEFYIKYDELDTRYDKTWLEWLRIPDVLFNPVVFLFLLYLFMFCLTMLAPTLFYKTTFVNKLIVWTVVVLLFFYSYSFCQALRESHTLQLEQRELKRRELKYNCHVNRMSFFNRLRRSFFGFFTFFGFQTDEWGYDTGKKCQELELELYKTDERMIDILYRTIIQAKLTIVEEILKMSLKNKVFFICLIIIFVICLRRRRAGHINGDEIQIEEKKV
jgi:hypothetical protein